MVGSRAPTARILMRMNWIGKDVDRLRTAPDRLKSGSNFPCSPDFEWNQFETKRAGRRANSVKLHGAEGIAGLEQDCQPAQTGHELAQDFEALPGRIGMVTRQSGNVSAWARQTFDDAGANRISRGGENDRDHRCRLLGRERRESVVRNDTSTLSRTNSAAISANRSLRPSAQR